MVRAIMKMFETLSIADYFSQIHARGFKVVGEAQHLNKKWLDMEMLIGITTGFWEAREKSMTSSNY